MDVRAICAIAILLTFAVGVGLAPAAAAEPQEPPVEGGEEGPLPCFQIDPRQQPPIRQVPC